MLSENLKEATLIRHQELEKKLVGRMRAMSDQAEYISLLQIFYAYFGGLEKIIAPYINNDNLPDYEERRKVNLIAADLKSLNGYLPELVGKDDLPGITNAAEALGALYVMEGSTLGGQVIKKMLSKQLGMQENYAITFFDGYGSQTSQKWTTFISALNNFSSIEYDDQIIYAANQTFQKFSDCFERSF